MITPRFELSQTENTITIEIRAPYCSLRELDVSIDENIFLFYCKPYHLRLHLPGNLEENNNSHSDFNSDTGVFSFTYDKALKGEHFENLEFITKFLCPKVEVQEGSRKIEIVSSTTLPEESVEPDYKYGFAQRGGYNFNFISSEFSEVFDINPFETPLEQRKETRIKNENEHFSFDHIVADAMEFEEVIESIINLDGSPWSNTKLEEIKFTDKELDYLKDLHNVEYNLTDQQKEWAFNGLLDILFAYCYDKRTTCFESTCESSWTITKLSATLSCFDAFETPKEALISCFRRSTTYPLYRSYELSQKILQDLREVLKVGEKYFVKILIEMHEIFLRGDSARYILNHLFIKDYIIYIQKWDQERWNAIVKEVSEIEIEIEDVGLRLIDLKRLEIEGSTVEDLMQSLSIVPEETDEDDED